MVGYTERKPLNFRTELGPHVAGGGPARRGCRHVDLNWRDYVTLDERFVRPAEVDLLIGDRSKAEAKLGWTPTVGFEELVHMMVDSDLERLGA